MNTNSKIFYIMIFIFSLIYNNFVYAQTSTRDKEIKSCKKGENKIWPDGEDKAITNRNLYFIYNHKNSPEWFSKKQVHDLLINSAKSWSKCGIKINVLTKPKLKKTQNVIPLQWNNEESRGNFAAANLTDNTLSLAPYFFRLLKERNPKHDSSQTLQMAISHEMGHFLGLRAHSKRCVDVMSYYTFGDNQECISRDKSKFNLYPEYRYELPTACDIKRCKVVNNIK